MLSILRQHFSRNRRSINENRRNWGRRQTRRETDRPSVDNLIYVTAKCIDIDVKRFDVFFIKDVKTLFVVCQRVFVSYGN